MNNMVDIFTEEWFYQVFSQPECSLDFSVDEIELSVSVPATEQLTEHLGITPGGYEELQISLHISMPGLDSCFYVSEAEDDRENKKSGYHYTSEQDAAALAALKRVVMEQDGCGLVRKWYDTVQEERGGSMEPNESELAEIQKMLEKSDSNGKLCRDLTDVLHLLDLLTDAQIKALDEGAEMQKSHSTFLATITKLREHTDKHGLPRITEADKHYCVALSQTSAAVQLVCYRMERQMPRIHQMLDMGDGAPEIEPVYSTLYKEDIPLLTCAEFAASCGVETPTVRQWIRRGKLRTAIHEGRDWKIPALAAVPNDGFSPALYRVDFLRLPEKAQEQYPYLKNIGYSYITLDESKKKSSRYTVSLNREIVASLTRAEMEKLELTLLQSDAAEYITSPARYSRYKPEQD